MTSPRTERLVIDREKKARDGDAAMREYEAERTAFLAKGERLRALRLAREEQQRSQAASKKRRPKD